MSASPATKRLRALRALARVEVRELARHPGRALLVALLVAIPVAALVGGSAVATMTRPTQADRRAQAMGRAALRVELGEGAALAEVLAGLPSSARVESVFTELEEVRARGRKLAARAFALDPEGLAAGLVRVLEGRAPANAAEIALGPVLLEGLELALGDEVTLRDGAPRAIVGVAVQPELLDTPVVLVAPAPERTDLARVLLVDVPEDEALELAASLRARGLRALAGAEIARDDGFEPVALFVLGGFGFFEAALVIAAAFAVGVRRRQREIGLLGAAGAGSGAIQGALLVSAALLASAGGVLGALVGIGAARALHPFLDGWTGRANGAFELSLAHTLGALLLGLVCALAAAALPARCAARLPIRVALGGRRPQSAGSRSWLAVAIAFLALGLATLAWGASREGRAASLGLLGGSLAAVVGLGASCPWLLATLARRAAPLPLAWRLALRDAGRFRARNAPVVAAVLAGMSISVLVAALVASVERSTEAASMHPARTWMHVLLALSVLTGLGVLLVATALSASESAADASVLHTVGAAPALQRRLAAARASYLALLGCALALPAGLIPAAGLMRFADVELGFAVPWPELALALLGLPAIAYGAAWSHAALRAPLSFRSHLD